MSLLRYGYVSGPIIGAIWLFVLATTISITMSFATGDAFRPALVASLVLGALAGWVAAVPQNKITKIAMISALVFVISFTGFGPIVMQSTATLQSIVAIVLALVMGWSMVAIILR